MKIRRNCLHNMLTKKGFFNTRFYVDDGISGTTFERDGFKTMLNDVQNGEVKTVIVKDYCAIIGLNQKDLENQGILA